MDKKRIEVLLIVIAVELLLVLFGIFILAQLICWFQGVTALGMPFFFHSY